MFVTKEKQKKIIVQTLKAIKCDICGENILDKKKHEETGFASLKFMRSTIQQIKEGTAAENYSECESSDFCETCYKKIVSLIEKLGAKIPSYYFKESEPNEDDFIIELFVGDDDQ